MRSTPQEICSTSDCGIKSSERKRSSLTSSLLSNRDSFRIMQRCAEGLLNAILDEVQMQSSFNCGSQIQVDLEDAVDYEQLWEYLALNICRVENTTYNNCGWLITLNTYKPAPTTFKHPNHFLLHKSSKKVPVM